jgi:hypothetical protein
MTRSDEADLIRRSDLLDEAWYCGRHPDADGTDAVAHFLEQGASAGAWPNPYFDTGWYLFQNPEVADAGINPLTDYIRRGEAAGCAPSPHFDLLWYRTRHAAAPGETLLRHFLARRTGGVVSPVPEFDPTYYLAANPDIARAGVDPFEHFLHWGYREGRNPSAGFDTRFYVQRHLDGDLARNPLLHFRQFRSLLRLPTRPPPEECAVHDEVRRFTRPGTSFERFAPLPKSSPRRAKLLAYYLPQFHAVPENDAWWGDGFTEWTFLARGQPRFAGHYQPRTPRDLGYYTLEDPQALRRQIAMARGAGVFGFVMYFYWFNGKRLLEKPLEAFLADASLDFPFCLMWANENWTRRWDGAENEVLISQDYDAADDTALVDCFARHFRDPRYIRVDGRPVLMVYRPRLIPRTRTTIARWRRMFAERHGESPVLVMAQSFGDLDPRAFGMDAAIEFPPHKLVEGLLLRNAETTPLDHGTDGQIFAYDDVVDASLGATDPPYPLIKTVVPSWDNDARRQGAGLVLHGSTPARYEAWLSALIDRAVATPVFGEPFVAINAWNEWAEGAYLEPDVHFGAAYANATARAVARAIPAADKASVLLVGHDAYPAGAQMLLLHLGRTLQARCGLGIRFLLLGGGALRAEYETAGPTVVATTPEEIAEAMADAAREGFGAAIVNSAASWAAVAAGDRVGMRAVWLIHELPTLLSERGLWSGIEESASRAAAIVMPTQSMADRLAERVALDTARLRIRPQGCYRMILRDRTAGAAIRRRYGIRREARLVLGAGTGDLRKGFDLFLQVWRSAQRRGAGTVFCWVGDLDPQLRRWLGPEIDAAIAEGSFLAPGFQADIADWFSAADAFALTSREDPFPTVVLEAASAGLPVVAFDGSGGAPDVIARLGAGVAVVMADAEAMAAALLSTLGSAGLDPGGLDPGEADHRRAVAALVRRDFDFGDYARVLLGEIWPDQATISVAVTSCDYAQYMPERLASVFAQTYPVAEIMVLDDASGDASVEIARATAEAWRREIELIPRLRRSGSPFGQWRAAAERARADWLWIAEADDAAEPAMLAALADAVRRTPDAVLVACDSRAIDADGATMWPDYQGYYAESDAAALASDFAMTAAMFARRFLAVRNLLLNVSAVLWRRDVLLRALDRCGDELSTWRAAGDWRVYLEVLADADPGRAAWVARPLNVHRRHAGSATGRLASRRQMQEIARMHGLLAERLGLDAAMVTRQAAYRAALARRFRETREAA